MLYPLSILSLVLLALIHLTQGHSQTLVAGNVLSSLQNDTLPLGTRAYWMRRANQALSDLASPCPFAAFGTAIVNHTDTSVDARGKLVCIGANNRTLTGNPILHGEIAAINNCTAILTDPQGPYNLTGSEALAAFADLSLYTNAESCPMCASAIRWAGFKEYIFGTTIDTLIEQGWGQIDISSREVFDASLDVGTDTAYRGRVLTNETDPYFAWQFQQQVPCPVGCARTQDGSSCAAL
ncbi:cytidine and deoxycytidylate deaminase zinc-binding region [Phlyctema vagabunda]|uniref:Cytidine and deoxycytidylate deaminase zinc-binding region n=1 Tax=Phlyctema vagabunda TaxID=108571 RepID=A0ABR4PQP4_9HELO